MNKYLVYTVLFLSLLKSGNVHSMDLDNMQKILETLARNPELAQQILETARESEEDSIDGMTIAERAVQLVPKEEKVHLDAQQIVGKAINNISCKKRKIFSINFSGIDPRTQYSDQLETIVASKEYLYNLQSLILSQFEGANDFVQAFFNEIDEEGQSIRPSCFISLFRIDVAEHDNTIISAQSLKSILDHFAQYNEVVRNMTIMDARNGRKEAFLEINGVSDDLLDQVNLSMYRADPRDRRTVVLKENVRISYRSGEGESTVNLIALLRKN
jgi:hypothetical protein